MTSRPRLRMLVALATLRLLSLSAAPASTPVARIAGVMPNTRPTRTVTPVMSRTERASKAAEAPNGGGRSACPQYRKQDPESSSDSGKQHALGEQLPDQSQASGAHRQADRQLTLTERRASEQQIGDIGAHQHEDEGRDGRDNSERTDVIGRRVVNSLAAVLGDERGHVETIAIFDVPRFWSERPARYASIPARA